MGKRSSGNGWQCGGSFGKITSSVTSKFDDGLYVPELALTALNYPHEAVENVYVIRHNIAR